MTIRLILLFVLPLSIRFVGNAQEDSVKRTIPDTPAEFTGGQIALMRYLWDHLKYPANCLPDGYCVKSYVRFDVLQDGSLANIEIVRGNPDCPEFDKNVIELIEQMPKWQPATLNGKPISAPFQLPIRIRLHPD